MSKNKGNAEDENKNGEGEGEGKGESYLGTWGDRATAEEGLKHLQTKLSEQGNEAGALRKEAESGKMLMEEMQSKLQAAEEANKANANDRAKNEGASEQEKIAQQIADLDTVDEGFSANLMALMNKSSSLAAKRQHSQTLASATEAFKKELDARDVKSAHQSFYGANPDFNTPEMQARIKDVIAKDTTGMSDSLSAYREVQRDDVMVKMQELTDQNAELSKRLELKQGTDSTGTVLTKGQMDQKTSKSTKPTRADRDKGMFEALAALKG